MKQVRSQNQHGHELFTGGDEWPEWRRHVLKIIQFLERFLPEEPGFDCLECGEYGHGWMVHDKVWAQIVSGYNMSRPREEATSANDPYLILCQTCAQKFLYRKFTIQDFTEVPINQPIFFTYMMVTDEDPEVEKDDTFIPLFLWSFMLEQLLFIRASTAVEGRWKIVHDYLHDMLKQGPFADGLKQFASSATSAVQEMQDSDEDDFSWRRFLKNALSIKPKEPPP